MQFSGSDLLKSNISSDRPNPTIDKKPDPDSTLKKNTDPDFFLSKTFIHPGIQSRTESGYDRDPDLCESYIFKDAEY